MKSNLLLIALLLGTVTMAQKPAWKWAKAGINSANASSSVVSHDASGNIYAAGVYTGQMFFGDSSLTATGTQSIFLVKYDHNGKFIWSKDIAGSGSRTPTGIAVSSRGEIYVIGFFTGKIEPGDSIHTSMGGKDMFIAKYQTTGEIIWAKTYGTQYDDQINGIAIGKQDDIFIDGIFQDTSLLMGGYVLTSPRLSGGGSQFFLAKQDSNGNIVWVNKATDLSTDYAVGINLDQSGNIYIIGQFYSHIIFDAVELWKISSGFISGDEFIAKYDTNGHAIWAKAIGGYRPPGGISGGGVFISLLTVDTAGYPIIGGNYIDCDVIFDKNDYSTSLTGRNMWMAKYTSFGDLLWAQNMGNNGGLYGITSDQQSNIYLTGTYDNGCVFDTITLRDIPVSNTLTHAFVTKFNSLGQIQWAQTAGDNAGATGFALTSIDPDEVIVTGQFYGGSSIRFGKSICQNAGTTGNGFVAALTQETLGIAPAKEMSFHISPNPANSLLHIEQEEPVSFSFYVLKDGLGRKILNGPVNAGKDQYINVSNIPAGLYFLELVGAQCVTQKLNIQH